MEDLKLPSLHPLLKIQEALPNNEGYPQWVIHHPVSNQFYKIGWAEFECISRFHQYETATQLLESVNGETTLTIDQDDIQSLLQFLMQNGLLAGGSSLAPAEEKSIWSKMMHGYLYFTVPLVKPDKFLKATWPFVSPLFSSPFHMVMIMVLVMGVIMTLSRIDEFFGSFTQIFTLEGIILSAIIMTSIKIFHEFAHAYTATKHGISVPHMGAAFIVMYPILYTEATAAWLIKDKSARIEIGLAGVKFELYLAAIALIAWHFVYPGLGQMICFTVVMISLVGSLLVNLNPLMRFDGYYVLSDYVGIENLHAIAIDYARHSIRKTCLGLNDETPHDFDNRRAFLLTMFGYTLLIYRLFLFLGISILVYMVFMKPLGLIAMMLELIWFIGLPIIKELKIWWERRGEYMKHTRVYGFMTLIVLFISIFFIPTSYNATFPAVMHAHDYQAVYAPAPSEIINIHVVDGQTVNKGEPLIKLSSQPLRAEIARTKAKLENLQSLKRREQTDTELFRGRRGSIDDELKAAQQAYDNALDKQNNLTIRAKLNGDIIDFNSDLRIGQVVKQTDLIFRVVDLSQNKITTYIDESNLHRFTVGDVGYFRPAYALFESYKGIVATIDPVDTDILDFPSLSSIHGGNIPSKIQDGEIKPLTAIYKITLKTDDDAKSKIIPGHIKLYGEKEVSIRVSLEKMVQTVRRELSLN